MLPEDVIAHEIEASMANELDALDWPMTNAAAEVKAGNARQVSAGRSKDHLLSKVSMWDAKVRDEVKKNARENKCIFAISHVRIKSFK